MGGWNYSQPISAKAAAGADLGNTKVTYKNILLMTETFSLTKNSPAFMNEFNYVSITKKNCKTLSLFIYNYWSL